MPETTSFFSVRECKNRNYVTTKNKKKTTDRLEFKKFCQFLPEAYRIKKPSKTARGDSSVAGV